MSTMDTTGAVAADPADGMPPFPDHPMLSVATVVGACAALVDGNAELREPSIQALSVGDGTGAEWPAVVADSLAYVLRMCGADPEQLWAAYFAISEQGNAALATDTTGGA